MNRLLDAFGEAIRILAEGDNNVYEIALRSLFVSGAATLVALVFGVAIGSALAMRQFRGRTFLVGVVNTGMGIPPVVVGLMVAFMLWRSGPLGELNIMYTRRAMVIAQAVIATPLVAGFTLVSLQSLNPKLRLQLMALGAGRLQMMWLLLREARLGILAAVMAGFGAVISEVGASLQVGGNISGETRVLTTATVLETQKGNFEEALALGLILVALMFAIVLLLTLVQQRRRPL